MATFDAYSLPAALCNDSAIFLSCILVGICVRGAELDLKASEFDYGQSDSRSTSSGTGFLLVGFGSAIAEGTIALVRRSIRHRKIWQGY